MVQDYLSFMYNCKYVRNASIYPISLLSNDFFLLQEDYARARHVNYPTFVDKNLPTSDGFQLPLPFPFSHPAAAFLPPMAPQQTNAASSGSSHSSEGSASSQHNWSFEEQFKQVRQVCCFRI